MVSETEARHKPLILVDGSSHLFRAFFALPALTTTDGYPTGAIRGFVAMIRRLAKDYPDSALVVIFDPKGKTFRDDLYPQYKANRPPMPDDLRKQIEPIHDIVRAMGLPLLVVPGVEADDVIGTLARQASAQGRSTLVSTSDKDMAQLVDDHVTLINTMSDPPTLLDRAGVIAKFGVEPEQIIDYLALMGDTVDNIPGVPKVGPKTAAKWLHTHGSLDGVMAAAPEIKGKVGENLRASLGFLPLSRTLTTIKCDVELELSSAELDPKPADEAALLALFQRFQFRSWATELSALTAATPEVEIEPATAAAYECVSTEEALDRWIDRLAAADLFAFDTETDNINYMRANLVGFSFAVTPGEAAYVPVGHRYPGVPEQLPLDLALAKLAPLLADPAKAKVGHHIKYDMNVLARAGVTVAGTIHDSMLESYVFNSTSGRHNMDDLAKRYLNVDTTRYEDVAGKGAKQLSFDQVDLTLAVPYAAEDADVTLRLHQSLWPKVQAEPGLRRVLEEIEVPLVPVLSRIERNGAHLDTSLLQAQSTELAGRIVALERLAHELAKGPFNLDSPRQLQEVLFQRLDLTPLRKTPKGQPSTAEPVLKAMATRPDAHPLPSVVLDYRALKKLKSTYTDKLPKDVDPGTGRIHTSYHQAVAATGRLSSQDPNLQNIPVRTAEGRRVRQAFCAPPGRRILAADYSQIELRIMAHLSGDEALLNAFRAGQDIHQATAAEVFGTAPESVTADQRRSAKAINFGLMYGMSAFGLANQLSINQSEAQAYIDTYFARYPGVAAYMKDTRQMARDQGYVETVFGRRLYLREIRSGNGQRRQAAERAAINAPLQGTAADIIKRAMIAVHAWLDDTAIDALMVMQVHDELVFEVAEDAVDTLINGVRERMSGAAELRAPLLVECGVGHNWDEAH